MSPINVWQKQINSLHNSVINHSRKRRGDGLGEGLPYRGAEQPRLHRGPVGRGPLLPGPRTDHGLQP